LIKPTSSDYDGRFRDIIADPVNTLIHRDSKSGLIENDFVYLHNGIKVPFDGNLAYYGNFSKILILNRGVHEPLEEFVFQQLLKKLPTNPIMLELGAYWGHYSMWLKNCFINANVTLVESNEHNLNVGKNNFERAKFQAEFILDKVCSSGFVVDNYFKNNNIQKIDVLHSDIQGYEYEMLLGAEETLKSFSVDYVLISTHSQKLHNKVENTLRNFGYEIEISSDFDTETTSEDGFILATNPSAEKIIGDWKPLGRVEICNSSVNEILNFVIESKEHFKL